MTTSLVQPAVADLLHAFADAPPERRDEEFRRLVDALWDDGAVKDLALPAVPLLVETLERVGEEGGAYLALLLGMLAEADDPTGGEVAAAVRQGIDGYLELWAGSANGQPLSLALAYLVGHFPEDRDRILAVAGDRGLDEYDLSKLDRALQRLDPENPVLGRVFPSPAVWALMDEAERDFDNSWIKRMPPEQIQLNWDKDTQSVLGNLGAMAFWAAGNGAPTPVEVGTVPPRDTLQPPPEAGAELFARHAAAFRCPHCRGALNFEGDEVRCAGCSAAYPIASGILNLTEDAERNAGDFLYKLAEVPSMGHFYEAYARPNFLRLAGSNWGAAVTPADEDAYIAEHVRPVDGPVLDLAAGAGRWTETLMNAVGADRLIALDMYPPMLTALRRRLPQVPAVMANARSLPFGDATLGAVMCWNALQAFPEDAAEAIADVGRCLRPGGTFTFLTFRTPSDPLARYFQSRHVFPGHQGGLELFDLDDIKAWLAAAGLTIRDERGPGTFVIITAERPR
ncbi:class I SAM-dependent methyltransferase [Microbispora sp. H11081]|uniref:class I SAM-dependent methyltransferase n=1 Tax=Microbispora sp. H11081 TaxID=2729107 RepID=UPI001475F4ED|nr:class I SAM-dependent methyltransferase [Microbispora sp. H11081]